MNTPAPPVTHPTSATKIQRFIPHMPVVEMHGLAGPTFPAPWGHNKFQASMLNNWRWQTFGALDSITNDPVKAESTGRIYVPDDLAKGFRIIVNLENDNDPWDQKIFDDMDRIRAEIKADRPELILSVSLGQARLLLPPHSVSYTEWKRRVKQLRTVSETWDEVSPNIYFDPGDANADGVRSSQVNMLLTWTYIAERKPLSPLVWWRNKVAMRNCTPAEFKVQMDAAHGCPNTAAVILWGDTKNAVEMQQLEQFLDSIRGTNA